MVVFRVARKSDLASIAKITAKAGSGLSTVPKSLQALEAYLDDTARFIAGGSDANRVLFVCEDNGVVKGISGIIIQTDNARPFYSFERKKIFRDKLSPHYDPDFDVLQLSTKFSGYSELGTLYLSEKARGGGIGKLLSFGRLAFIQTHRAGFKDNLMADIRGWYDAQGVSPFWTHVMSKFVNVSFEQADKLMNADKDFFSESFPESPIYLSLLGPAAQACVGKPNDHSAGALKMLLSAGFKKSNFCNILDGGPALECKTSETIVVRSIQKSRKIADVTRCKPALHFSGHGYDFRAVMVPADVGAGVISKDTAQYFAPSDISDIFMSDIFQAGIKAPGLAQSVITPSVASVKS